MPLLKLKLEVRSTYYTTTAEEMKLVEYCLHMASIGYGCTHEQVCLTVKKIQERDGHPKDNKPGRKWWTLFKSSTPEYPFIPLSIFNSVILSAALLNYFRLVSEFRSATYIVLEIVLQIFGMQMRQVFPCVPRQEESYLKIVTGDTK